MISNSHLCSSFGQAKTGFSFCKGPAIKRFTRLPSYLLSLQKPQKVRIRHRTSALKPNLCSVARHSDNLTIPPALRYGTTCLVPPRSTVVHVHTLEETNRPRHQWLPVVIITLSSYRAEPNLKEVGSALEMYEVSKSVVPYIRVVAEAICNCFPSTRPPDRRIFWTST